MDPGIFDQKPMGLIAMLLRLRFGERFSYDTEKNMFFIKFEGHKASPPVTTRKDKQFLRLP